MRPAAKTVEPQSGYRKYVAPAIAALVLLAGGFGIYHIVTGESPRKRVLETVAIKLVQPPPPEVKPPPEPPKMVEEQKIEQPVDKPMEAPRDEPPPGPLALDAKGEAGSDAFGLGGKLGGADFLGGGGGGTRFGHFAILMQTSISKSIHDDEKLNAEKFRATVKVWLSEAGKIQRVQVMHTSGDVTTDSRIEQVIAAMPALPEAPPKDMPQPIVVRIGARAGIG
jgi:protein TonB